VAGNVKAQNPGRRRRVAVTLAAVGTLLAAVCGHAAPGKAAVAEPKRVVLIGATAKSAPAFFRQAFALGYEVVGVARRPEAVEVKDPRLTVVKGDVYDEKSIEAALTGNEVVVSYLSCCRTAGNVPHGETLAEVDLLSKGIWNVIAAMKARGNRRLIAVSSTSVEHVLVDKPADDAPEIEKMMWNGRHKFDDQRRMETIIIASGLDYTIVRPARVTGDVSPGTPLNIAVNRISYDPLNRKLSRPDLAAFILKQMDSTEYVGSIVGVYN
jgi:putative NADH-flavin reductase